MTIEKTLVDRIRKLLALGANNPEEHEARAAFQKAAALAEKHGFALADVTQDKEGNVSSVDTTEECVKSHSRYKSWEQPLISILGKCFDCHTLVIQSGGKLSIFGTPEDVSMAMWYFKLIRIKTIRQGSNKFQLVLDQKEYGRGVVAALRTRLYEMFLKKQEEVRTPETTALVIVKNELVVEAFEKQHPVIQKSRKQSYASGSAHAFFAGVKDGKTMGLHRNEIDKNKQESIT